MTVMLKPTLDVIQLSSMLDDSQRFLGSFDFAQVWEDTLQADPVFPVRKKENFIQWEPKTWPEM